MVIENRQAAEAACDVWPDHAIIWCQGQVSDLAVDLISQAADGMSEVLICPDADLGGVRIAARILDHLPPVPNVKVLDAGAVEHPSGKRFNQPAQHALSQLAQRHDQAGTLARASAPRLHSRARSTHQT